MPIHVIGPPGTGKTERLIQVVREAIDGGLEPTSIAYLSFTRAAISEARHRIVDATDAAYDDLEMFRTMHSMAYRALDIGRDQIVSYRRWTEFCEEARLTHTTGEHAGDEEELFEPVNDSEEGDTLRRLYDYSRNSNVPLQDCCRDFDLDELRTSEERVYWYARTYEDWKQQHNLVDFIDLLQNVWLQGWRPSAEMIILDEAQDLSPLQRDIFKLWIEDVPYVYLGYDDDQCIYQWQGADPRWLLEMSGARQVLQQSYRVPRRPASLAQRIIEQNYVRYPKEWRARDADGELEFDVDLDEVVARLEQVSGTTMFLARSRYYLRRFYASLTEAGYRFRNLRGPDHKPTAAMSAAFSLAQGLPVSLRELHHFADKTRAKRWWERGAKAMLERMSATSGSVQVRPDELIGYGANDELAAVLSKRETCLVPLDLANETYDYWNRVYTRYGSDGLTMTPKITLSTIHGVKGGEADNVVLLPNFGPKTYRAYDEDPEPERRVWYVATSRAKENLTILAPQRGRTYDGF